MTNCDEGDKGIKKYKDSTAWQTPSLAFFFRHFYGEIFFHKQNLLVLIGKLEKEI